MKVYRSSWRPCRLVVNFNHKQWRQDLAAFVVKKLNWFDARVTKVKTINGTDIFKDSIKEFEIYTAKGDSFKVQYTDKSTIISSSSNILLNEYLLARGE